MSEPFDRVLDEIYRSYMRAKQLVAGMPDRDVRKPRIILDIAERLKLIPERQSVVKVTGSKGKGTTTRLIAELISNEVSYKKTGLLISPEEIEHTDRMRINGKSISTPDFIKIFEELHPTLLEVERRLNAGEYLSPFGIFLLVGLTWFRKEGVRHFVLEGGRGARFDEVGQIESKVGVVTSILNEHPTYLGPSLEDIARDKLSILNNSNSVVLDETANIWVHRLKLPYSPIVVSALKPHDDMQYSAPKWYRLDLAMAKAAVGQYLGRSIHVSDLRLNFQTASFGTLSLDGHAVIYEAVISLKSLDREFVDKLTRDGKTIVVASLPDDKDVDRLVSFFNARHITLRHVVLTGTRGYLHYHRTEEKYGQSILATINYDDTQSLKLALQNIANTNPAAIFYLIGTHTFIRLVKRAMDPSLPHHETGRDELI